MRPSARIFVAVVGSLVGFGIYGCWSKANAETPPNADCVDCHSKTTPNVVEDWKLSKHAAAGIGCDVCHGSDLGSSADPARAKIANP